MIAIRITDTWPFYGRDYDTARHYDITSECYLSGYFKLNFQIVKLFSEYKTSVESDTVYHRVEINWDGSLWLTEE